MSAAIEVEIGAGPRAGTYSVHVSEALSGGEPSTTVELDVAGILASLPQIEDAILASSVGARRVMTASESAVQRIGARLFDTIFTGTIGEAYRASAAVAVERGLKPQLTLQLTAPELAALPWEAMFDAEADRYVSRKDPIVRRVPAPFGRPASPTPAPLRILGMVSGPRGLEVLDVEGEKTRLESALRHHIDEGLVDLRWLDDASWSGLHNALLTETWHVVHFVGHGGYDPQRDEGLIAFVGPDGRADYIPASSLADLLNEATVTPRLVVLNSCQSGAAGTVDLFSGTAATLVHSGINAVVAMQFAVSDYAALAFSQSFYVALASGRPIDEAVRSGRIGILGIARETLEWITPVLYLGGTDTTLLQAPVRPLGRVGRPAAPAEKTDPVETDPPREAPVQGASAAAAAATPQADSSPAVPDRGTAAAPPTGPDAPPRRGSETPDDAGPRRAGPVIPAIVGGVLVIGAVVWAALALLDTPGSDSGSTAPTPQETTVLPTTLAPVAASVAADQYWSPTGVECDAGDVLEITATGQLNHDAGPGSLVGPEGLILADGSPDPRYLQWNVEGLPDVATASLIGSLDQNQPFFAVGPSRSYLCPSGGTLFLGINDINLEGNHGAWQATVVRTDNPPAE